jgi:nitrogen fixation protein FixH
MMHNAERIQLEPVGPKPSDKWIPWYFVAFFVVLAMFDGVFVYIATQTHTGVVSDNAYNEGLRYNETIASSVVQNALGWKSEIKYTDGRLSVNLQQAENQVLTGAVVEASFIRPTQDGGDFRAKLIESGSGVYEVSVAPAQGQWDVRIFVTWKQIQYQAVQRVIVPKS